MSDATLAAQNDALLRAIMDGTTDVVFVRDLEGRYLLLNSVAARVNGVTVEALLGHDDSVLFPPEIVREIQEDDRRTVQEGVTRTYERTLRPRGEARTYLVTKGPCRDREGDIFGVFVISRDITERKRIEDERTRLLESLARAQAIARIGNWERELATNKVYWSVEMCRLMGVSKEESIDGFQDFLSVVHPEDRERVKTAVGGAIREGQPYSADYRMLRRDGTILTVHATGTVERDEGGRPVRIVGTAQDITERKRFEDERARLLEREHALREEADRARVAAEAAAGALRTLEQITETALASLDLDDLLQTLVRKIKEAFAVDTVALLLFDDEKRELVVRAAAGLDDAMVRGLRVSADRGLAGRVVLERRPIIIDDLRAAELAGPTLRDHGVESLMAAPLRLRDRTIGLVHVGSLVPRRFTNDEATLLQLAADRIAVAIEHAQLYEQARRATRVRDEILGIVAHDLRNPLYAVVLHAQLMRRAPGTPEDEREPVEAILASARHMDRLVQDLLDVTRIEAGELTLELDQLAVAPLIAEAIELARPLASAKSLRLETRLGPALTSIRADRHRILQVLGNLLGNAVKFTGDDGRITVTAKLVGPDVQISVADTGRGIREEHLPHVFDRFWQATVSDQRSTGLGLSIANGLVRQHGGRMWVESTLGAGSTFFLTLPAAQ